MTQELTDTIDQDGALVAGVMATPWAGDDWALVVGSGSDLAELCEQAARMPAGLAFAESFGDVDLVLVYRPAGVTETRQDLGSLVERVVDRGGMLVGPVVPGGLSGVDRYESAPERAAFLAGQADALGAMRRALTDVGAATDHDRSAAP